MRRWWPIGDNGRKPQVLRLHTVSKTIKTGVLLKSVAYILIAGLILMLALVNHSALSRAYHQATSHQAETYSELYLDNNTKLPTQVTVNKPYAYRVHVANHESSNRTYVLVSTITTATGMISNSTRTVYIPQGQAQDVAFTLNLHQLGQSVQVTVALQGTDQYVTFRSKS